VLYFCYWSVRVANNAVMLYVCSVQINCTVIYFSA
jgi:hypothetical protein